MKASCHVDSQMMLEGSCHTYDDTHNESVCLCDVTCRHMCDKTPYRPSRSSPVTCMMMNMVHLFVYVTWLVCMCDTAPYYPSRSIR